METAFVIWIIGYMYFIGICYSLLLEEKITSSLRFISYTFTGFLFWPLFLGVYSSGRK